MKKRILLITLLFAVTAAQASENLIRNGDFSDDKDHWLNRDIDIKRVDKNERMLIKLDNKDKLSFMQLMPHAKPPQNCSMQFKYKTSPDYSGNGIKIFVCGSTFSSQNTTGSEKQCKLQPTEEWITIKWDIHFKEDMSQFDEMYLKIWVLPGNGKIYFDDFKLVSIPED